MKKEHGFTLVEILVALGIFLLIGGAAFQFLFSSFAIQRNTLGRQMLVNQLSFVVEYMSRAVREAEKDLAVSVGDCLTTGDHLNYEVLNGGTTLRFLDKQNRCREILLNTSTYAIQERISPPPPDNKAIQLGAPVDLTADDIEVQDLYFFIDGEEQTDRQQPRVTFFIKAQTKGYAPEAQAKTQLQTTISPRRYDVQE